MSLNPQMSASFRNEQVAFAGGRSQIDKAKVTSRAQGAFPELRLFTVIKQPTLPAVSATYKFICFCCRQVEKSSEGGRRKSESEQTNVPTWTPKFTYRSVWIAAKRPFEALPDNRVRDNFLSNFVRVPIVD